MKRGLKIALVVLGVMVAAVAVAEPLSASGILPANLGRGLWVFRVRAGDTTANTKIADFKSATGVSKASIDIEGDAIVHDLSITGSLTPPLDYVNFATGLTVDTNAAAFASSGALRIGTSGASNFTVAATGATVCASTVQSTGNFSVGGAFGASKAEITASSGAIQTDGTLTVDGAGTITGLANLNGGIAVATDKFTVSTGGNTVNYGTFKTGAAIATTTLSTVKGIMGWTSGNVDVGSIAAGLQVDTDIALTGVAAGDLVFITTMSVAQDSGIECKAAAKADNIILQCWNNTAATAVDPAQKTYSFLIIDLT